MNFPLIARYLPKLIISDLFGLPPEEVKRCGFSLCRTNKPFVYATDLEAALAKGVRVEGNPSPEFATWFQDDLRGQTKHRSHSALLIGIHEIQPESAESLLQEFLDNSTGETEHGKKLIAKARAFLARSRK